MGRPAVLDVQNEQGAQEQDAEQQRFDVNCGMAHDDLLSSGSE